MSLVVVGTDTEVGKTVISGLLMRRYRDQDPVYWKPIATGGDDDRDVVSLRRWLGDRSDIREEHERFPTPASPHLSARLVGARIDPSSLDHAFQVLRAEQRPLVVEGIGGLLVPLTDDGPLLADWLATLDLPCLLVARSTLGTINHTLLSLEASRRRGLRPIGVVLNGPRDTENRLAIERFGRVPVVAEVEPIAPLNPAGLEAAARAFDREGHLARWFEANRQENDHAQS